LDNAQETQNEANTKQAFQTNNREKEHRKGRKKLLAHSNFLGRQNKQNALLVAV